MKQYFSYSEMRAWFYDRGEYVRRYVKGEEIPPNRKSELGTIVHSALEDPRYPWMKELKEKQYQREYIGGVRKILDKLSYRLPPNREEIFRAEHEDIKLFAVFDGVDYDNHVLTEYKTSDNDERWNQWIVDYHDQLSFYALMYHRVYHRFFNDIVLYHLNPKKGTAQQYHTVRSRRDIDAVAKKINLCVTQLKQEGLWEQRLSREEKHQRKLALPSE